MIMKLNPSQFKVFFILNQLGLETEQYKVGFYK